MGIVKDTWCACANTLVWVAYGHMWCLPLLEIMHWSKHRTMLQSQRFSNYLNFLAWSIRTWRIWKYYAWVFEVLRIAPFHPKELKGRKLLGEKLFRLGTIGNMSMKSLEWTWLQCGLPLKDYFGNYKLWNQH